MMKSVQMKHHKLARTIGNILQRRNPYLYDVRHWKFEAQSFCKRGCVVYGANMVVDMMNLLRSISLTYI